MNENSIQVVKDGLEKFLAGDIPEFLEILADDVY